MLLIAQVVLGIAASVRGWGLIPLYTMLAIFSIGFSAGLWGSMFLIQVALTLDVLAVIAFLIMTFVPPQKD